jgi:hypothetical protein
MSNAQRLYNQTCRHLQAVQANIDRLAELNANEELALHQAAARRAHRRPMAATNKCLAQSNKSRTSKATKKREIRQPGLIRWAQPPIRPYPRVR